MERGDGAETFAAALILENSAPAGAHKRDNGKVKFKNPGLKILDLYIIKKFLGTYFFAIAMIIVVFVVFDYVEHIDDFVELKAPVSKILFDYYLNFIPQFINQFSGLFTFIAVIFFTSKMAYQTEIIAILSAGVSFRRLLWPYFLSAMAITLLSVGLNMVVIPAATLHKVEFEKQFNKKKLKQNTMFDKNIYRQIDQGVFAYVRNYSGVTNQASFLAIEQYEGSTMSASLEAASVTFNPETGRWVADRYNLRRFDGEREIFEQRERLDTLINLDAAELGRVQDLIKTMNIGRLNSFIAQQRRKGSNMINIFEVERHNRFAYPISSLVLTLIGVSLSSRKVRGGTGLHIGIGVALCFSYILFSKFAEEFAKGGVVPPAIAVWIPNILFSVIAVYLYKKAPK